MAEGDFKELGKDVKGLSAAGDEEGKGQSDKKKKAKGKGADATGLVEV